MTSAVSTINLNALRSAFGERLQERVRMANYTTAHVGGEADAMLIIHTAEELEVTIRRLWDLDTPYYVIGAGSNLLVAESGVRTVIIVNRARNIKVDTHHEPPTVWAESGANLGTIARQVALRGLSGLEWGATVPGTLGGAVFGNAGAHGGDMAGNLVLAEILHRKLGRVNWSVDQMDYTYRSSALKNQPGEAVLLAARLTLGHDNPEAIQARMEEFSMRRRRTQPPGASLGSMFKNPTGDYAGRLIEAAGLKATRRGGAEISPVHANFFINLGDASADDIGELIALAQTTVKEKFNVQLELEVELLGDWSRHNIVRSHHGG
jgi:UDP-N-acetylmuramate dehydrogenase